MTLQALLIERRGPLCRRWLEAILREYGELTAARWLRQRDQFANPVGHTIAAALPALLETVAGDGEPAAGALSALEAVVRIRSVQDLAPSRAVGFVRRLRGAIREELAAELAGGALAGDLEAVDSRIELLTSAAFDTYVRLREEVFRLRQQELKRSVASILRQWHGGELGEDPAAPGAAASPGPGLASPDVVQLARPATRGERR